MKLRLTLLLIISLLTLNFPASTNALTMQEILQGRDNYPSTSSGPSAGQVLAATTVAVDTQVQTWSGNGNANMQVSITVASNSNRALVLFVGAGNQTTGVVSSVTGAGATWSRCATGGSSNGNGTYHGDCFVGVAPLTGAQTVTVNFPNVTNQNMGVVVYSVYNVNQTTPTSNYGSATTGNLTIPTLTGDMTFSAHFDLTDNRSVSGCTTTRDLSAFAGVGIDSAHCVSGASTTYTWGGWGGQSIGMGVNVKQDGGGTPDTTPPVISSINSSSITQTGATVSWNTDENSDTQVEYGLTLGYGQSTTLNSSLVTSHSDILTGLTASTLYHYRVKSRDASGNLATSADQTFITTATPPTDTTAPSVPTGLSATAVSSTQINLSWTASTDNVGVTGYDIYRNGSLLTTVNSPLTTFSNTGLTASTNYSYTVRAKDAAGNVSAQSSSASATTQSGSGAPPALPEGSTGIAASYPNDTNIQSNANVIFADNFESYTTASQLTTNWNNYYQSGNTRIATEAGNFYAGAKSLEFTLPASASEVSNAVIKNISPTQDTLFVRVYTKFDPLYDITVNSNHNGIRISSQYPGPGTPPNGTDFFLFLLQNTIEYGEADPGYTNLYVYHPEQRSQWGDEWFPNGRIIPFDQTPGNWGPYFVPRPDFIPQRDRWYSYELMVKANTPGQRDGRAAIWIDGVLMADFQNIRVRDVSTLKIDQVQLELHAQAGGSARPNKKWYDNVVVAKSYIGPMTVATPPADTTAPSVPTNLSATAVSSSAINLSWTASTDAVGVTGYKIYRAGTQIGTSATNSYSDTGLSPSTSYSYTVSAYDAANNNSSQSTSASATTQSAPTGNTVTAASCSQANVQAAINSASPGWTVIVPAGTCSWTGLSISGIQLIGAGKGTNGTVITSGSVTMTKHASQYTRVSGFRFTGTDTHISAGGSASNKPFVIDNNYLFTNGGAHMLDITVNGGLIHHNDFFASSGTGADVLSIATSEDWSQAPTYGNTDTTGERNIYLEDNVFTNILETAPDGDVGGRYVIRYNTYVDSSIVFHGGAPNDSSPGGGTRQFEVYNNIFDRVSNSFPINKWIWARGSSGVIANNNMERADSPDGSSYPNKHEISLTLACPSAYPMQYQIGQSNQTPQNPPTRPLLIFGNTGAGSTDSNFISVGSSDTAGGSCASPGNYIQSGRDYMLSNTWGWVPYTYPHPLQALSGGTPPPTDTTAPSVPTGLTATAISTSQINLTWTASTDNVGVTGYKIYRNGSLLTTVNSPLTTYSDTGLIGSTSYTYTVSAYDAAGNNSAQSTSATTSTQSGQPVPGDLNSDHIVNALDYSLLNSKWLQNFSAYDLQVDGLINSLDFAILSSNWGRTW